MAITFNNVVLYQQPDFSLKIIDEVSMEKNSIIPQTKQEEKASFFQPSSKEYSPSFSSPLSFRSLKTTQKKLLNHIQSL